MARKTHKTAVVIIPPMNLWQPIQSIREKYDRQFRRWMPHITMIYPFRPIDEFEVIYKKFIEVCRNVEPFEVEFSKFNYFHHGGESYTVWLEPNPRDRIAKLQDMLQKVVPDCDDVRKFKDGFTPHLSIGQVRGREELEKLLVNLQGGWIPIKFEVKSVFMIWRNDPPDDIFRVWGEVKFRC
jgi:2'-5' RNA ligase